MLADAMSSALLGISKDVSPMANLDKSDLPAVVKNLVDAKGEQSVHSSHFSALKERTIFNGAWWTVNVNLGWNLFP